MTRAQMVLDWIGWWLDGEDRGRIEIRSHVYHPATGRRFHS